MNILNCMKRRSEWYGKAISILEGDLPRQNGFDFPPSANPDPYAPENLYFWRGAKKELDNTICIVEESIKHRKENLL